MAQRRGHPYETPISEADTARTKPSAAVLSRSTTTFGLLSLSRTRRYNQRAFLNRCVRLNHIDVLSLSQHHNDPTNDKSKQVYSDHQVLPPARRPAN